MTERLPEDAVTYADIALLNMRDGSIAAGIQLSNRSKTDEGRTFHTPYFVISAFYADLRAVSTRQLLPVVVCDVLRCAAVGTRLVIFRGNTPHFQRNKRLREDFGIYGLERGIDVRFMYMPANERTIPDLALLANDAIRRRGTVEAAV